MQRKLRASAVGKVRNRDMLDGKSYAPAPECPNCCHGRRRRVRSTSSRVKLTPGSSQGWNVSANSAEQLRVPSSSRFVVLLQARRESLLSRACSAVRAYQK
jgi:hypothetical protein